MCSRQDVTQPIVKLRDAAETVAAENFGLVFGGSKGAEALQKQTSRSAQASRAGQLAASANKNYVYEKGVAAVAGADALGIGVTHTAETPVLLGGPAEATAGGAAAGAGTATGAASGALTVKDVAMTAAAVAGTASAAYSIYAAKHAPKPPGMEPPPTPPQPGVQPDVVSVKKKNLFGDDGPFARDATFLTGPGGVAPGSTNLGRNILLGN